MTDLAVAPMQWASIEDLHDCEPINQSDIDCMNDIRSVLDRHGKLERFAIHLVHKHFDVADDEVIVEFSNADVREQFFKVEKITSDIARNAVPTTWLLKNIEPMALCVCAYRPGTGHLGRHETGIASKDGMF